MAKRIYQQVAKSLRDNRHQKFVIENMGYFRLWYQNLSTEQKSLIGGQIKSRQLEILNKGSVSSPDEGTTYYQDLLDNTRSGSVWLAQEGITELSDTQWMIDNFGHSFSSARVARQTGMKYRVLGRTSNSVKYSRAALKEMIFRWQMLSYPPEYKKKVEMLSYLIPAHYNFPENLDIYKLYDTWSLQRLKSKFKQYYLEDFDHKPLRKVNPLNLGAMYKHVSKAKKFVQEMKKESTYYKNGLMMVPFGDDFQFYMGRQQYSIIDNLLILIKSNNKNGFLKNMKIKYSITEEFFEKVEKEFDSEKDFKVKPKYEDFFPYVTRMSPYSLSNYGSWAGYFTTRPWFKLRFQRYSSVVRKLKTLISFEKKIYSDYDVRKNIEICSFWVGVFTHHDAITGTSTKRTMDEYDLNLNHTLKRLHMNVFERGGHYGNKKFNGTMDWEINIKKRGEMDFFNGFCDEWESEGCEIPRKQGAVTVYSNKKLEEFEIGLAVDTDLKQQFELIAGQELKESFIDCSKADIYGICVQKFVFNLQELISTFGFAKRKTAIIEKKAEVLEFTEFREKIFVIENNNTRENSKIFMSYHKQEKYLEILGDNNYRFQVSWAKYYSLQYPRAGLYALSFDYQPEILKIDNLSYAETQTKFIIKAEYKNLGKMEIILKKKNFNKGPMPLEFVHHVNKEFPNFLTKRERKSFEIVVFYKTQIEHEGFFYTDSNGLDLVKRRYASASNYSEIPYKVEENYYPINRILLMNDTKNQAQVGVYVDRPTGCTVHIDGKIDIGLQRLTYEDDGRGVKETFIPNHSVAKRHFLFYGGEDTLERMRYHQVAYDENSPLVVNDFDAFALDVLPLKVLGLLKELEDENVVLTIENKKLDEMMMNFVNLGVKEVELGWAFEVVKWILSERGQEVVKLEEKSLNYAEGGKVVEKIEELKLGSLEIRSFMVKFKESKRE